MKCVKHGNSDTDTCPVCLDLELAQEARWLSDVELAEDLADTAEFKLARRGDL